MRYLLAIVVAAAALGATGVSAQRRDAAGSNGNDFTRIFPDLPPFAPPTEAVKAALSELGRKGGLMDARDNVAAGPIELILNPGSNRDSDAHTAGVTFMGQFLDHDMTFDTTSRLGTPTNPHTTPNARRPYFDLDSVYGDGPSGSPLLYEEGDNNAKFRVEHGGLFEDLPRDAGGRAIIADPRNDENLVISGLQVAFLLFHNQIVDRVRDAAPLLTSEEAFHEARKLVTLHYQWLLLHEFLPQFVGQTLVDEVRHLGGRFYPTKKTESTIPIEFQMAYRFGHSLVRPSYRANFTGDGGGPFFAMLFDAGTISGEPADLRGGARGSRRFIGWQTFFEFPGFDTDDRPNKRIDTKLSTPLFDLPLGAIASGLPPVSLAERNLLRHLTWNMPSGQTIAAAMGEEVLADSYFSELKAIYPPFVSSTPLWFYVLREADVREDGERLGPVGGRLVAEVFIGLLRADPNSILNQEFVPSLGPAPGEFRMIDLLRIAEVDPKR